MSDSLLSLSSGIFVRRKPASIFESFDLVGTDSNRVEAGAVKLFTVRG